MRPTGFSTIEVLFAAVIVALALTGIGGTVNGARQSSEYGELAIQRHYRILHRFETVMADPFVALDLEAIIPGNTPTAYSDALSTPDRILVFLSRYDGDNADADADPFTGVDANLIWLRVEDENSGYALETLTSP